MLIRCINRDFRDLKAEGRPLRRVGEEWEATPERLAEINRAGYGVMAEAAPEAAQDAESDEDGREPARADERAAEAAPVPQTPTADELEALTNRELVELCIKNDVETKGRPKHDELVAALKAHFGLE